MPEPGGPVRAITLGLSFLMHRSNWMWSFWAHAPGMTVLLPVGLSGGSRGEGVVPESEFPEVLSFDQIFSPWGRGYNVGPDRVRARFLERSEILRPVGGKAFLGSPRGRSPSFLRFPSEFLGELCHRPELDPVPGGPSGNWV